MSASLNQLVAEMRPWARALVDLAGRAGLAPRVTSTRRSHSEQGRLYRSYLAGKNPYPVAPPGESAHEFGYAFDLAISPMTDANLRDLGQVWTGWGGVWGGVFDDPIHFEFPGFPHAAIQAHAKAKRPLRERAANIGVSFLPAAGWLTLADPNPLVAKTPTIWPGWADFLDPFGFIHDKK